MAEQASNAAINTAAAQQNSAVVGAVALQQPSIVASALLEPHPSELAYIEVSQEFPTVSEDENVHINVDVIASVTTVLGVLPRIRALRADIAAEFPRFNLVRFDKLEKYTLALSHAHTWSRAALIPKAEVTQRAAQLEKQRDQLLLDAQALAAHNLLDASPLKSCKTVPGHRALASDVLTLVKVLKDSWPQVQGKTPQSATTLNAAATAALELLAAIGLKEQGGADSDEPSLARRRAFTLFRRAYEDVRRAAIFLHGEEEAEEIAPSLYAGRGGRRPLTESGEHQVAPVGSAPASGVTSTPVAGSSGTGSVSTTGIAAAVGAASTAGPGANGLNPAAFAVDNRAGLPITHPLKD